MKMREKILHLFLFVKNISRAENFIYTNVKKYYHSAMQ